MAQFGFYVEHLRGVSPILPLWKETNRQHEYWIMPLLGPSTPAVVGHVSMPKFIVNLFCIHITSGMKHRADVESELDKRWLQYKMCNSAVNAISEIFIKSSKFLDLREISEVLRKAPPSPPPLQSFGRKNDLALASVFGLLYCFLFLL